MRTVFISYRRDDSRYPARLIYNALCVVLPPANVFFDVESIEPGESFPRVLRQWAAECDTLLALMGPEWIGPADPETGARRLDNPEDFVRIEVAAALARSKRVVPVLVDGAPMPPAELLPRELKKLAHLQAEMVDFHRWNADVERLIERLGLRQTSFGPRPRPAGILLSAVAVRDWKGTQKVSTADRVEALPKPSAEELQEHPLVLSHVLFGTVEDARAILNQAPFNDLRASIFTRTTTSRSSVADVFAEALYSAVDIRIIEVLAAAWTTLKDIQVHLDRGSADVSMVPLVQHSIVTIHQPSVEILLGDHPVGQFTFELELALTLRNVVLAIGDGRIFAVTSGSCAGAVSLKFAGTSLADVQIPEYTISSEPLPGDGIPIA
jgi:TIR domain